MPMNKQNQRYFYRRLFAGIAETITLLKRGDNQQQGTVRAIKLFDCWMDPVLKTGETIQGGMDSNHSTTWHIPMSELKRTGINYLAPADIIKDRQGRYWQPESTTTITVNLMENEWGLDCLRIDPPPVSSSVSGVTNRICEISSIRRTNNTAASVNPTPTAIVRSNTTVNANVATITPKSLFVLRASSGKFSHSPIRYATTISTALNAVNGMNFASGAAANMITSSVTE